MVAVATVGGSDRVQKTIGRPEKEEDDGKLRNISVHTRDGTVVVHTTLMGWQGRETAYV